MTFASLFSGVGGADLGLERAGMRCLWHCEIDRQASDVLRYRWPHLTNYGDVMTLPADEVEVPDVLWMSPPCQDLSVAGKRAGLAGERSGLFYDAIRIAVRLRDRGTRWVLMEQVPGLFSSNGGEDVRQALYAFLDLGVSVAWRVLDSQCFGVPQRRRRAFFVVDLRGERAAEVLALAQGLRGDSAPSREAGEEVAPTIRAGAANGGRGHGARSGDPKDELIVPLTAATITGNPYADNESREDCLIPTTAKAPTGSCQRLDSEMETFVAHTLRGDGFNAMKAAGQGAIKNGAVAFGWNKSASQSLRVDGHATDALQASSQSNPAVASAMAVRRLTPRECERLQGWPDDHTRYGRKPDGTVYEQADGPRYKQCGNGVTANVAEWIGRNLLEVEHAH